MTVKFSGNQISTFRYSGFGLPLVINDIVVSSVDSVIEERAWRILDSSSDGLMDHPIEDRIRADNGLPDR